MINTWFRPILPTFVGFAMVLLAIWGASHWIVQPRFVELDQTQGLKDGARARATLHSELRQLSRIAANWAEWDDAYAFAADRNPWFIQSNLGNWVALEKSTQINLCAIFDQQGQRLYSGGYDSDLGGSILLEMFTGDSAAMWSALRSGLDTQEPRTGLLLTERGLLLMVAHPILTTQGNGPARGLLIFGRFLDKALRQTLVEQAHIDFDVLLADEARLTPDERNALTTLPTNTPTLRSGLAETAFVYEVLPDWFGQPVALMRMPLQKSLSTIGQHTSQTLLTALGLTALILLISQAWWCHRIEHNQPQTNAPAWIAASLVLLTSFTLMVDISQALRQHLLPAVADTSLHVAGGILTLLLVLYLLTLLCRQQQAEALAQAHNAELQASEHRFRRIVEQAPFGFHFYHLLENGELVLEEANPTADTLLKRIHAQYIGQPIEAFLPALATTDIPDIYRQMARTGGAISRKIVEYHDENIAGNFEVTAFQTAPQRIAVAFSDVTERQCTERHLRQSEEKFSKIFLTMPEVTVISRAQDGLLLDVNPGFEAITGYSRAEAIGRTTTELELWVKPQEREQMIKDLNQYQQVLYRDFSFRRNDGAIRSGQFSARTLIIDDEVCVLFVMRDITEHQQIVAKLQQRDHLLQTTADAMALLLSGQDLSDAIQAALATIGTAIHADRAYVFENHTDPLTNALLSTHRYEWCAQGITPQIDNPALQNLSYQTLLSRWYQPLASGTAIKGLVRDFPDSERALLEPQDIHSILVLPIRLNDDFWGFIGFDDCSTDRVWTSLEENILRNAGAALGHLHVRQQAEAALRESEEQYRTLVDNLNIGVFRTTNSPQSWFLQANPTLVQMFGYDSEVDFLQISVADLYASSADRQALRAELLERGQIANKILRMRRKDGTTFWAAMTARIAYGNLGQIRWIDGVLENVTLRYEAEARQQLAAAVFEAAREAILVTDTHSKIIAANPAFTTLTGYTETDLQNRTPRRLWADRPPTAFFAGLLQTLTHEGVWQSEFWLRRKDGQRRAVLANLGTVRDSSNRITHYVGIASDITQQKEAEQRIEHLAYYDALTDLPNRALLIQRAELALALAARRQETLAVLLLDMDRFKEVNDALGHAEGDTLLLQAASRLQAMIRSGDTLCRLGGDEFAVLLPGAGQEGALRVTDKIITLFRQPFSIAGHSLPVTVSIGIVIYPHDGADFTELLKNADTALYRAKREGGNTWAFYTRQMNIANFERLVLEGELREAIQKNQLRVYYQPKVRLTDRTLVGAEALVRWQHPVRGLIPPGQFIPVAEASDLIVALGDWVLVEVCRQIALWQREGRSPGKIAVNLAARHFRRPSLATQIEDLIAAQGLPPSVLELELTESTLLEANASTANTLKHLKQFGICLALDDFGTGYSSLSYLKRLPLTALKIDQSFVRDLVIDADDRTLAATIVTLGHQMELEVVAEGVETEEQRQILLDQGCDLAQGYLFDRPLPADQFSAAWLQPASTGPSP